MSRETKNAGVAMILSVCLTILAAALPQMFLFP